eukprot:5427660-Alexandrium_andersonii.AAC.1
MVTRATTSRHAELPSPTAASVCQALRARAALGRWPRSSSHTWVMPLRRFVPRPTCKRWT